MGPEDRLRAEILKMCRARGGVWNIYPKSKYSRAGVADIFGCYLGRYVAIEVKRKGSKGYGVTALQGRHLKSVNDAQGYAIATRSETDVALLLNTIERCVRGFTSNE